MAACEILETCIFFNDRMDAMPSTSEWLKARYCRSENRECARYIVYKALGRPRVPIDLYPTQIARAQELLAGVPLPTEPSEEPPPSIRPSGKPVRPR